MWSKCGNTSRGNNHGHHDKSYDNFNFTRFDQRNQFFVGVALSQAQQFGTATSYGPKILQQCDKRVKTKSHKVLRANSYVRGE